MTSILRKTLAAALGLLFLGLASCNMGDDTNEKYAEWRKRNIDFVNRMQDTVANGVQVYSTIRPGWAPGDYILMKWHNDRSLTEKNLVPLYNSTCRVKYHLSTIESPVDSTYNLTEWGDSLYQCKPNGVVPGFAIALTNMHVGDSCTVILPYFVAYDSSVTGKITRPYTTLIYELKLVSIPAYEIPM